MRNWLIAAPFIFDASDHWLARFISSAEFNFRSVPAQYRHDRSRPTSGWRDWSDYFYHGREAWREAETIGASAGVIACFPQLATTIGLQKRAGRRKIPLVAWNFNIGTLGSGVRTRLARFALSSVDRFVVHSRSEISVYAEWLKLPCDRFRFVPLQRAVKGVEFDEDTSRPFVLSMGTAHRDYRLLFEVLRELRYDAIVVAAPHAVAHLSVPQNVKVMSGVSLDVCHELVQRARVNIVPIANGTTASGQVTFLDAMMFGRPTIVTRCAASNDYISDGVNGLLVPPRDADAMRCALQSLWNDQAQREKLGVAARQSVINQYSDTPVARIMGSMLAEFK